MRHEKFFHYFSYLASAPIVAGITFIILGFLETVSSIQIIISIIFASVIPLIEVLYWVKVEKTDYDITQRKLRIRPLIVAIFSYLAGFIILLWVKTPVLITGLMLAYAINTFIMLLVTFFWKISIHAAGITGPLTFIIYKLGLIWGFLYLLVIPVGIARIKLKEHTVSQVIAGTIVTIIITWLQIIFVIPIIAQLII